MKLTPKKQAFADKYIKLGNATQSAINAGYSKKTAYKIGTENLRKPQIKEYITVQMDKIKSDRIISATEAVELLSGIARGSIKETVIVGTPTGMERTEKEADLKPHIRALTEILSLNRDTKTLP